MNSTLKQTSIGQCIETIKEHRENYQKSIPQEQGEASISISQQRLFFQYLEQATKRCINTIALFTLLLPFLDSDTQEQFYQAVDTIIQSLIEFDTSYQGSSPETLFKIQDVFPPETIANRCAALEGLFVHVSAMATPVIIERINHPNEDYIPLGDPKKPKTNCGGWS